jgi:hypothetical protein
VRRRELRLRFGYLALLIAAGGLLVLGIAPLLWSALHLGLPSLISWTGVAGIIAGVSFVAHFFPAVLVGTIFPQVTSSQFAAAPGATATEVITPYVNQSFILYDAYSQTSTVYATADEAMNQALTNLQNGPYSGNPLSPGAGEIHCRAGTYVFNSQHQLTEGASVIFETGNTVSTGPSFSGSTFAQFTLVPIFVLDDSSSLIGAFEVAGASNQALAAMQYATNNARIQNCGIATQVQIPINSNNGPIEGLLIQSNIFNVGVPSNPAIAISLATTTNVYDNSITISDNQFLSMEVTVLANIGSNFQQTGSNSFLYPSLLFSVNVITLSSAFPEAGVTVNLDFSAYVTVQNNYVNMQYSTANAPVNPIFLKFSGVGIMVSDNVILTVSGSTASNGTGIQVLSTGNDNHFHVIGNMFQADSSSAGSTSAGFFVQVQGNATNNYTVNEIICQDNVAIGCSTNHYYFANAPPSSGGSLTVGHTITIAGNYSNRCGEDNVDIEPVGGAFGDVHILNNHFTDYNWTNNAGGYAGIALNRGNSGYIYGPVYIDNNSMMSSDGGEIQLGIFVQGNVYQLCITGRNTALKQTQFGVATINPIPTNQSYNTIFGNSFTIPGSLTTASVPASGATGITTNQTACDADLVISGGTVTKIQINGITMPGTSGVFHMGPLDTVEITYTGTPTTWTYIIHGG